MVRAGISGTVRNEDANLSRPNPGFEAKRCPSSDKPRNNMMVEAECKHAIHGQPIRSANSRIN
jgi:hypothetical protein